jgi:cytochrome c peroxidase
MSPRPVPSVARLSVALVVTLSGCGGLSPIRGDHTPNASSLGPLAGLDLLVPVPEDNPLTFEKIALGKRLFFDAALSVDGGVRCASCHRPDHAFSDSVAVSRGAFGRRGQRNAPALVNRAYGRAFFWDGRAETLESVVAFYDSGGVANAHLDPEIRRLGLTPEQRRDLVAFLEAFTGTMASGPQRFVQKARGPQQQ